MDFIDRFLEGERKNRRRVISRSVITPWVDLMDYIDDTKFFTIPTENIAPGIRLNNGWAEMRGTIFPDVDYGGGAINDVILPLEYRPPVAWAECFVVADDDSSLDFWPYGGGWALDIGGTGVAPGQEGFMTFEQPILVFKTNSVGAPTMQYPNLGNNRGWPKVGAKINLENARWVVEA